MNFENTMIEIAPLKNAEDLLYVRLQGICQSFQRPAAAAYTRMLPDMDPWLKPRGFMSPWGSGPSMPIVTTRSPGATYFPLALRAHPEKAFQEELMPNLLRPICNFLIYDINLRS